MRLLISAFLVMGMASAAQESGEGSCKLPIADSAFEQQVRLEYGVEQGLPDNDVRRILVGAKGDIIAYTTAGAAAFDGKQWRPAAPGVILPASRELSGESLDALHAVAGNATEVRAVAVHEDETAVAADTGLYLSHGRGWNMALPQEGKVRWAPVDVRAVCYDTDGRLWFAAPQGVGCRIAEGEWKLFTGAEGLPYNDFTCMAAGPKGLWLGTSNGAICYHAGQWAFRCGRRWLPDNQVRDIAVDGAGNAWIATPGGVACIAYREQTLAAKAAFFEKEIEQYHRRTCFGYVNPARLSAPGDKRTAVPVFTDNDGHFTGLYLGAVSLGYTATGNAKLRQDAANAFRALSFLSEVTQGGPHPAPEGFIARSVIPVSEPDPNPDFDRNYDLRRRENDAQWKLIQPRWPLDATGQWYWKNDSSSDELDGHFFGYAIYFDRVCERESEKESVRAVVRRIIGHILSHDFSLVDHDGQPTRWGHFSPDDLNRNPGWCDERGLNSLSILTYLSIAHHITGDPEYRKIYMKLALDHGYAMNGMAQPKSISGPGFTGHQPDDNMAFINYYHLIRYETDPTLLDMYYHAILSHWQHEKSERNAFTNFVYAACCLGKTWRSPLETLPISPPAYCLNDAVNTLRCFPLDLVNWPVSNAHRIDMIPFPDENGSPSGMGARYDGQVFPIDERPEVYWDLNPWALVGGGDGARLREGIPYLLAYYMALAHGFISLP